MISKSKERPLGNILHIINGEAICQPNDGFRGKNALVVLEDGTKIGKLGDPFGPVSRPYQPILLFDKTADFIGKSAFAIQNVNQKNRKNKKKKGTIIKKREKKNQRNK